jgi:hypothetical protein
VLWEYGPRDEKSAISDLPAQCEVELGSAAEVVGLVVVGTDEDLAVLVPGAEEAVVLLEVCGEDVATLEAFIGLVVLNVSTVPDSEIVEDNTVVFEVEDVASVGFAGAVHLGRTQESSTTGGVELATPKL